ncbi:unnamed protein product [Trichobilharzia regenti]|nr:unnamed protein product [Trichobilharzia regenti]
MKFGSRVTSGYSSIPIYNRNTYPSKQCRRRKARTVFSDHQLTGLEHRFETQHYLSTPEQNIDNNDDNNNNHNNIDAEVVQYPQTKTVNTAAAATNTHSTGSTKLDDYSKNYHSAFLSTVSLISSPPLTTITSLPFSSSFPCNCYTSTASSNNTDPKGWTNFSSQLKMNDLIKNFLTYDMIDKGYLRSTLDYINNNNNKICDVNNIIPLQNDTHYTADNLSINNNTLLNDEYSLKK